MSDVFDVEAYLEEKAATAATGIIENESERKDHKENKDRTEKSPRRERSRDRSRDRSRERRRDSRDRDRRRRRSSSRDRRRDSRSRSYDRRRGSDRDRERDRGRDREREKDKEKEREPPVDREELRRKREIEDLTKDQRTIFVGQLTKKVNERTLESFFGQIGKVKNIIMVRDKHTGAHKGFAYVEMEDLESIPNCLLFNDIVPDFQVFKILVKPSEAEKNFLAKKDPFNIKNQSNEIGGAPETRIYVGNININIDEAQLKSVLDQFGPVDSIKLHRDSAGNSKGFAFVKFVRPDSAAVAMQALPGIEIAGRALKVGPVVDHRSMAAEGGMPSTGAGGNDMYSASNNWKLDADEGGGGMALNAQSRLALMAKLGQNAGIQVPIPQALSAMNAVNNSAVSGATIPPVGGSPSRYILICNMFDPATETEPNWDMDIKEDVADECGQFGVVEHCFVEKQKPGGLVYLRMQQVDAAAKAANALNGRFFAGRMITVTFLDEKTYTSIFR